MFKLYEENCSLKRTVWILTFFLVVIILFNVKWWYQAKIANNDPGIGNIFDLFNKKVNTNLVEDFVQPQQDTESFEDDEFDEIVPTPPAQPRAYGRGSKGIKIN